MLHDGGQRRVPLALLVGVRVALVDPPGLGDAAALQIAVMLVRDAQAAGEKPNKMGSANAAGVDRMSLLKALGER